MPVKCERTNGGGKWKIEQCSVGPETAISFEGVLSFLYVAAVKDLVSSVPTTVTTRFKH